MKDLVSCTEQRKEEYFCFYYAYFYMVKVIKSGLLVEVIKSKLDFWGSMIKSCFFSFSGA